MSILSLKPRIQNLVRTYSHSDTKRLQHQKYHLVQYETADQDISEHTDHDFWNSESCQQYHMKNILSPLKYSRR